MPSSPHPRIIPGYGKYLGFPGYLDKGGGVPSLPHPRMIPGWSGYLGIPRYLDKGGCLVYPILG